MKKSGAPGNALNQNPLPSRRSADAKERFEALIVELSRSDGGDEQAKVRKSIWDEFGTTGCTFISDMANFSSTSRTLGVCHFLMLIQRARDVMAPIIHEHGGLLLKCDADNCYAFFEEPDAAIGASYDINAELFRANEMRDIDERIYMSVGIDYGEVLLVGEEDFYGDPVNTASKLGEDLAGKAETLVTERALNRSTIAVSDNAERMIARISDIEISYVRIPMTRSMRGKTD